MATEDLTPTLQELVGRMSSIQAELNELKTRSSAITGPAKPQLPAVSTTRRKTLRRLGLALLGGAATAATLGAAPSVEAKVSAHPTANGMTNRVGMLVLPPSAPPPTGIVPGDYFGIIACADRFSSFNASLLSDDNVGVIGYGSGNGEQGVGVIGRGFYGVKGFGYFGVQGSSTNIGVEGYGGTAGGNFRTATGGGYGLSASGGYGGVYGNFPATTSVGLIATAGKLVNAATLIASNQNVGLYATADGTGERNPTAAFFDGAVAVRGALGVQGNLTKTSGTFKIDHPLDPENKYLYHSFVESPDMMNIYNGIITLDKKGEATVKMPDWFEALNRDFRYQLTSIGVAGPNLYISQKITGLAFKIAGGQAGQEVSWMVTGIRQDAWAKAHPIQVEEDKTNEARGKFLHPEVFGKPDALRVGLQ